MATATKDDEVVAAAAWAPALTAAEVRGEHYHLSQARPVTDPRGTGDLDCWAATATWTDGWPP